MLASRIVCRRSPWRLRWFLVLMRHDNHPLLEDSHSENDSVKSHSVLSGHQKASYRAFPPLSLWLFRNLYSSHDLWCVLHDSHGAVQRNGTTGIFGDM